MDRYSMAHLKAKARRRSEGFDLYKGVWDKPIWHRIRVKERVQTALSVSFKPGDIALARYGRDIPGTPPSLADVMFGYSLRSGAEMAIYAYDILPD